MSDEAEVDHNKELIQDLNATMNALEGLEFKWKLLLDDPRYGEIRDPVRRLVLARLFENIELSNKEHKNILLEMVRYIVPKYLSFEFFGTIPMTGPVSLSFFTIVNERCCTVAMERLYESNMPYELFVTNMYLKDNHDKLIELCDKLVDESNREYIKLLHSEATKGSLEYTIPGEFDLNVDYPARWIKERIEGLVLNIERESYGVGQETNHGCGNFVLCSEKVAGYLNYAENFVDMEFLDYSNYTGLCVGNLNKKYNVFIDPWANEDYYIIGYRGYSTANPLVVNSGVSVGLYHPVQLVKSVDSESYSPRASFKSRNGIVSHPFSVDSTGKNKYYRKTIVKGL
jgi:hypothetical protein